jgi:hypothetical protein
MPLFRKFVGFFKAAGVALRKRLLGGPAIPFIEDVFSTFLYTGNGSTQTITNGIDLSGKGGLVWAKARSSAIRNSLFDTSRGAHYQLTTDDTSTSTNLFIGDTAVSFNNNGFTTGSFANTNTNAETYVSWTFRKQPKFFDIVTYTGNGTSQTISHALGSTPGSIFVKRTDQTANWIVYHIGLPTPNSVHIKLNLTNSQDGNNDMVNGTSSTTFSVGSEVAVNASGGTYVAYLFAHNAGGFGLTGTDNVISCGAYTGTGSPLNVTLGYEPQWVLVKKASASGDWILMDTMRGMSITTSQWLYPASTSSESASGTQLNPTATGFTVTSTGSGLNGGGATYIYIAIRKGPMNVPTVGTSVFYPQAIAQADSPDSSGVPFPPDLVNMFSRNGTDRTSEYDLFQFADRLRGLGIAANTQSTMGLTSISSSTAAELSAASYIQLKANSQNITRGTGWNSANYGNWISYFWRRAPSFFDIVCYTGTGAVGLQVTHNLTVAPELLIVKRRNSTGEWDVYCSALGATKVLELNSTGASFTADHWNNTTPTSTYFTLYDYGNINASGGTYVAYLFASCPGVSKVGSYTGTGTTLQIDCGFTAGARFVLIKRTDSTGAWYVWDTARGIVSGNDPYLLLNNTAAEDTSTDYIDPYSAGFEISSTAPAAINASAGTFIFLAIA